MKPRGIKFFRIVGLLAGRAGRWLARRAVAKPICRCGAGKYAGALWHKAGCSVYRARVLLPSPFGAVRERGKTEPGRGFGLVKLPLGLRSAPETPPRTALSENPFNDFCAQCAAGGRCIHCGELTADKNHWTVCPEHPAHPILADCEREAQQAQDVLRVAVRLFRSFCEMWDAKRTQGMALLHLADVRALLALYGTDAPAGFTDAQKEIRFSGMASRYFGERNEARRALDAARRELENTASSLQAACAERESLRQQLLHEIESRPLTDTVTMSLADAGAQYSLDLRDVITERDALKREVSDLRAAVRLFRSLCEMWERREDAQDCRCAARDGSCDPGTISLTA